LSAASATFLDKRPGDGATGVSVDLHPKIKDVDRYRTAHVINRKVGVISVVLRRGATVPHSGND
jgi:hypothetical protein